MKNNIKSIYKFEFIILLLDLLLLFIPELQNKSLIAIAGFGVLFFISLLVFKKRKDTNLFRASAFRVVFAIIVFYFIIIFLLGLLLGFGKTLFSLKPSSLMQGLIPALVITVLIERLRFILIKNNITDKLAIYLLALLTSIAYVVIKTDIFSLSSSYSIFVFLCELVMTTIASELLVTFMDMNYRIFTYSWI